MPLSLRTYQLLAKCGVKDDALTELFASIKRDVEVYEALHAPEDEQAERAYQAGITDVLKMSRRRRKRQPAPDYWGAMRKTVHERDNYTCQYCGCDDPDEMSVDHVIPKSRGGSDELGNLKSACFKCNNEKGNFTLEEWTAFGKQKQRMTLAETKRSKYPGPTEAAKIEAASIAQRTVALDKAVLSAARRRDRAAIFGVQSALDALDRAKERRSENNSGNRDVRYSS